MRIRQIQSGAFQGHKKRKRYFEGWYFKHTAQDGRTYAVIPGISLAGGRDHAFIQIVDGMSGTSHYITYEREEFSADSKELNIQIGSSRFSAEGMTLDIRSPEMTIQGTLSYGPLAAFPVSYASPGIMGWYAYVPFMECFHGVVSMHHSVSGSLECGGVPVVFDGGSGYIEKDWGTSFPGRYIWIQSNDFSDADASVSSFLLSIAAIPWLRREFTGFLCYLKAGDDLYRFATYTGSTIEELVVSDHTVSVRITDKNHVLWVSVQSKDGSGSQLSAPNAGSMERFIHESVESRVRVTLKSADGAVLFDSYGDPAGFELVGDASGFL